MNLTFLQHKITSKISAIRSMMMEVINKTTLFVVKGITKKFTSMSEHKLPG